MKPNQNKSYIFNVYKGYLALNNQQLLVCYKTQPNQILYILYIYVKRGFDIECLLCHKTKRNNHIYFYIRVKRGFGIKYPTMIDMP